MTERAAVARRNDVREAITSAAARLLGEHGRSAVTTRAVAAAAGVQAPTIYRLFGDKDGLLEAVAEQVMSTYVSALMPTAQLERERDADPVHDLRDAWRTHIEFSLANPDLFAILNEPGRFRQVSEAGIEVLRQRVRRIADVGRLAVGEDQAVMMIHAAGTGAVSAILAARPKERDLTLGDAMFEAVARVILTTAEGPTTPLGRRRTVGSMDCDDYQRAALRTARAKDAPDEFMHLVLGLVGEAGEIAEKVKKLVRDHNSDLDRLDRDGMAAELGDVLWYTAVLASFLGLSLDDVAQRNVDKLADRQRRAVLGGSGDNR